MKKIHLLFISAFCCLSLIISSCKKTNAGGGSCTTSVANLAGTYSFVKIEATLVGSNTFGDVTSTVLTPCQLDDKIVLNADGSAVYQDAGTVCSPPGDGTGNWILSGNVISSSVGPGINGTISSFDCTNLVLVDTSGSYVYRLTIKK